MNLVLVYPPFADATQPYASLPALAAFLRMRGNHSVELYDANLEFCLRLWTRTRLNLAARRLEKRLIKMEAKSTLSPSEAQEYTLLMAAVLKGPHVAMRIEQAVRDLRRWETFDSLDRLAYAKRVLQDAADILGVESPLLCRRVPSFSAAEISRLTNSPRANPFGVFLEKVAIPQLRLAKPGAVGISITYLTQIVPAIALARLIRMQMPSTLIILGGQIASVWYNDLPSHPQLFDWCDYIVGYEGETALDTLLTAIETGAVTQGIANVASRDGNRLQKESIFIEDVNSLPTPDYSGLPLERYLAPEPVLLASTSRGCYWGKCTFCSVSPSMRSRFRMRTPDVVVRDLLSLRDRYSIHCITLADDCVPPVMLRALAQKLAGAGLAWQCEVRFEPALTISLLRDLAAAGCKNLIFGLESYSQRVLGSMHKGVGPAVIERTLRLCRDAGLAFNLQFFFGFPGETAAEAEETIEFVSDQLHGAATVSFGRFRLQRGSAIAREPAAFGITMRAAPDELGTDLECQPVAPHALAAETRVADRVVEKTGSHNRPLGLDAHTLLYLYKSGVQAMAKACYAPHAGCLRGQTEYNTGGRWRRKKSQTLREFRNWQNDHSAQLVLYDYHADRAVELSQIAGWVVSELDEYASTDDIAKRAAERAQVNTQDVEGKIESAIQALHRAGLLESESDSRPRKPAASGTGSQASHPTSWNLSPVGSQRRVPG